MDKLELSFDTLDAIPDISVRDLYETQGDKFVLKGPIAKQVTDTGNLGKTLKKQSADIAALTKSEKEARELLAAFGDLTPDDLEELRTKAEAADIDPGDEEARKKAIEDAVARKEQAIKSAAERREAALVKERDEAREAAKASTGKLNSMTIERAARDAALKKDVSKYALKDAIRSAQEAFTVNDQGEVVARDDSGLTLEEHYDAALSENPHWTINPASQGSGDLGGGMSGGKRVIKRADWEKLDPARQAETMKAVGEGKATLQD